MRNPLRVLIEVEFEGKIHSRHEFYDLDLDECSERGFVEETQGALLNSVVNDLEVFLKPGTYVASAYVQLLHHEGEWVTASPHDLQLSFSTAYKFLKPLANRE